MKRPGWFPPDGAVAIQAGPAIACAACGRVENAATPRNALRMRERHRCPAGTPKAVPRCPVCDSTETVCYLLDGAEAPLWHPARTTTYNEARADQ